LEGVYLEHAFFQHLRELLKKDFQVGAVRLQVSQQLGIRVKAGNLDDVLSNDANLGVGTSAVWRSKEDNGVCRFVYIS
jgi:hypothetical protein